MFGTAPASIKAVALDPYSLGIVRLGAAALVLSLLLNRQGVLTPAQAAQWPRRTWVALAVLGVVFGLHWLAYFVSIAWASATIGAIGFTTFGVQLPLLGWMFGFGRPHLRTWAALAMALAGAMLCLPQWSFSASDAPGLVVAIVSGTFYAALPLLHQRFADLDDGLRTWGQFCFALPVFLALAQWAEWNWRASDVWLLVNLTLVITVAGHYLWVQAISDLPVQITAVLAYLQLPTSVFFAWLMLGEQVSPAVGVGAALVIGGNVLAVSAPAQKKR